MQGGRSNEPLDLGTITAKLFDALKVGELAPDFDVERIGTPERGRRRQAAITEGSWCCSTSGNPGIGKTT